MKTAARKDFSYEILRNADDVRMILYSYVVKTKPTELHKALLLLTLEPMMVSRSHKSIKCMIPQKGGQV